MDPNMSFQERLEQLEASHIALMAEYEVEVRRNDRAWRRHRRWLREYNLQREQDREDEIRRRAYADARAADLDRRIADLVSGIGEFIRRSS